MKHIEIILIAAAMFLCTIVSAQETVKVTVRQPDHGTVTVSPALEKDGTIAKGTDLVVKVEATDQGWTFDSGFYRYGGRGVYMESMTPVFQVKATADVEIGGSIMEAERAMGYTVIQDIYYAKPGIKALKYDVFIPDGAKNLPCIVIMHGGGWNSNVEDIMRGEARELVKGGRYVVCSIDYRWADKADGDEEPNTMCNLIEDCYGAILHIQEHAAIYGIDPMKIAVTGDSAGGHLSAATANMVERVGDGGFGIKPGVYEFLPTYIPQGMTVAQARESLKGIKAAAPSYGIFDVQGISRFVKGLEGESGEAIAPVNVVPNASVREIPQYLALGTNDFLVKPEPTNAYIDFIKAAGQRVELNMVEGASHAFLDWKPDQRTKDTFVKFGEPCCADMLRFFDSVFYK